MIKVAIAIDDWKLPIFERQLSDAGYKFEQSPGLTDNTLTLMVQIHTLSAQDLEKVVRAANAEAGRSKLQ